MKKEKIKLTKNIAYTLFTIGLVLLVIGVSYAAYTFSGTGTKENVITTGQIQIAFSEQNNIKLQNRYPETDAVGIASTDSNSQMTWTVSGNISGDAVVNYAIGLTSITAGATLTQDYIKIYLTKNGSVASGFTEGSGKTIRSFETSKVTGYLDSHAIAQGSITGTQVDTYVLKAWIDENYDLPTTDTSSGNIHSATTTSETFSFKIKAIGTDSAIQIEIPAQQDPSNANVPKLATNMIPVIYDSGNSTWVKADSSNKDLTWFNYTDKKWANAVTVTSTNRDTYLKASVGTPIAMSDINTMLVWIPRFSATGDTANYNGGTVDAPGAFNITFVDKNTSAHDAFTFGTDSLSGFWIGKFENSSDTTCEPANNSSVGAGCNLTTIRPKILPNATSWRGASISTFFYDMLNMTESGNQYGFDKTKDTNLDTHMLKNNEWGAVAYLTQSIYGRCTSSTSCTEVGINNNSSFVTGYGAPAGYDQFVTNGTYETSRGMDASTTGNIYGVYDMSGGAYEFVMGNYNNTAGDFQYTTLPNTKYYNVYTTESDYTNAGLQHAMTETSGWYGDNAGFLSFFQVWLKRGGVYNDSDNAGVFEFSRDNASGSASTNNGSRASLTNY